MSVVQVHLSPPNSKPTVLRLWAFWFGRSGEHVHCLTQPIPVHLSAWTAQTAIFACFCAFVRRRYSPSATYRFGGHALFHTVDLGDHWRHGTQGLADGDRADSHGELSECLLDISARESESEAASVRRRVGTAHEKAHRAGTVSRGDISSPF